MFDPSKNYTLVNYLTITNDLGSILDHGIIDDPIEPFIVLHS